jgi:two-component system sensor histidine kinase CpxA
LLLWFFLNLVALLAGLYLTVRFQFGPEFGEFLPETAHAQTQAMAEVMISDLAKTPRDHWDELLASRGAAYHMDFALFDQNARRVAGADLTPPDEARTMILMTAASGRPLPAQGTSGQGESPQPDPISPEGALPPPGGEGFPPPGMPPPGGGGGHSLLPDFPQKVVHGRNPDAYWLLIHLPLEHLHQLGIEPLMLVGRTTKIGECPLLFNPSPWVGLAAGMLVFSILFWLPLTRNLTGVISRMTQATESIAKGNFDVQVPEKRSDELGRLGFAINRMASRLKGFTAGQRRFLGDVAHEICSPLARMEVALGILEERGDEKALPYVRDVREEVTHMRKLAHELLSFSKAALGENRIRLQPMAARPALEEAVRQEHCEAGQVEIDAPEDLMIEANPELLSRALGNLIRNAVRYAGEAGPITLGAWAEGAQVVLSVADQGPGVPAREIEKLFDPFYRLDESRQSETGGTGLGLAIVKTCIEACRGTVTAANRVPRGLEVQLRVNRADNL